MPGLPAIPPSQRRPTSWWFANLVWLAVLWWLSSHSPDQTARVELFSNFDKVAHFGYFFCGGMLLSSALHWQRPSRRPENLILLVLAGAALVGAADEYHQTLVPGRSGNDPFDWLADIAGGGVAAGTFCLLRRDKSPCSRGLSDRRSL